jgi:hypothetical protein
VLWEAAQVKADENNAAYHVQASFYTPYPPPTVGNCPSRALPANMAPLKIENFQPSEDQNEPQE